MSGKDTSISESNPLLLRRAEFLLDCCEKPLVILNEEGNILEGNKHFQRILDCDEESIKLKPFYWFCDEKTNKEIKRVLKHRSLITSFSFRGNLTKGEQINIPVNISAHYIVSNEFQNREIILLIEPEQYTTTFIVDEFIQYLGKTVLPQIPLASQIVDVHRKVLYSINLHELPFGLQDEIKEKDRVCCYLLKKGEKHRECICEKVLKEGNTRIEEVSVIREDSEPIWLVFVVVPLKDAYGNVRGLISTINNITEERRFRRNIEELLKQTQLSSTSSQLAIALARHLKNPLTVIMGSIDLLCQTLEETSTKAILEKLKNSCNRCKDIVNKISDFSNNLPTVLTQTEINALIRSMVLPLFASTNKEVVFRFYPTAIYINCIPYQFAKSCVSILENAIRYAEREVVLEVHPSQGEVCIEIYDDGKGVSEEIKNRIFEPFFTTENPKEHTGLGLTLAKTVVESFGGRIELRNSPLGGANFVITMPIFGTFPEQGENIPLQHVSENLLKKSILIIEDEEDLQELIVTYFQKQGFVVEGALNSDEAITLLNKKDYDVIILDLQLPGKVLGYQIYDLIKTEKKGEVIVITADTINIATQHFLKKTNCEWLEKPFQIEDLNKLVQKKLKL